VCDPDSGAAVKVDEAPPSLVRVSGGYFGEVTGRSAIVNDDLGIRQEYTG
jgi:hypothetical protein